MKRVNQRRTGVLGAVLVCAGSAPGADCTVISVGLSPINDLGTGLYLGQFQGGLYPAGANAPPAGHAGAGLARALAVQPRDPSGAPSATGRYALLSIGMSNTTQEFCSQGSTIPCDPYTFVGQAGLDQRVERQRLALVNGAAGGQTASSWDSPGDANYERIRTQVLPLHGLSEAQVQVVWLKVANAQPTVSLPNAGADAYTLVVQMGSIVRALKVRYPNLQQVFISSRIYAGYASTALNPEPYAYESAFAVKWLIEAQINQMAGGPADPRAGDLNYNTVAPWVAWGPYLWADGLTARSDGLIWACADLAGDGTHPAPVGRQKVGTLLQNFFLNSSFSQPWFLSGLAAGCYANCDQSPAPPVLNVNDFLCFQARFAARSSYANCDRSTAPPLLNVNDFTCFLNQFGAGCP